MNEIWNKSSPSANECSKRLDDLKLNKKNDTSVLCTLWPSLVPPSVLVSVACTSPSISCASHLVWVPKKTEVGETLHMTFMQKQFTTACAFGGQGGANRSADKGGMHLFCPFHAEKSMSRSHSLETPFSLTLIAKTGNPHATASRPQERRRPDFKFEIWVFLRQMSVTVDMMAQFLFHGQHSSEMKSRSSFLWFPLIPEKQQPCQPYF